jgi:type IV pilus assembly protein PilQ
MSNRWKLSSLALCMALGVSAPAFAQQPERQVAAGVNAVASFEVSEAEDGTYVRIKGSSVPTFSVFKLADPPRLFVDIAQSAMRAPQTAKAVRNGVISQVAMVDVAEGEQSVTRVIIGFETPAFYDVRAEGNDVVVFIDGAGRSAPADGPKGVDSARYDAALGELDDTRSKLDRTQREMDALRDKLARVQGAEREAVRKQIADKNEDLKRATAERDAARTQLAELQRGRAAAEARAAKAEARATKVEARADSLAGKLDATERERLELTRRLDSTKDRAAQTAKALSDAERRAERLESELAAARKLASSGDVAAKRSLAALERDRDASRTQLDKARAAAADAERRADSMSAQLKGAEQRAEKMRSELARRDAQLADRDAEVDRLRAQAAQAEREARAAKSALAANKTTDPTLPRARAIAVDPNAPNIVRDIRLETVAGRSRIVVELERPGRFETREGSDGRAVMILNNTDLPQELERTLSASSQSGAVRFVSSFVEGEHVRMEAELGGLTAESVQADGNTVTWEFASQLAANTEVPLPAEEAPEAPTAGNTYTSAPPLIVTDPSKVTRVPGLSRKRLTIDLRNIDVQNVLRLIAKEGDVNIIAGEGVSGNITLTLRRVPLEQVFLTVLQSRQLGFEVRGNVIRVAPQSKLIAEETARAEARAARKRAKPLEVFLVPINYATANELMPQVQGLLSGRGSVTVDQRTNTLIIKDINENIGAMRTLIESLDMQVPQVLIEARIVETNNRFSRQIGIQWGGDFSFSQANGNPTGLIFPSVLGVGGAATDGQTPTDGTSDTPNFAVNLPAPIGTGIGGGIGLTMGSIGGGVNLNLRLSAQEAAGNARIISAPKILTLNNNEASISQGTSIPISVVSAAGVQTVFVDATLELTVRPQVTPDGNILLNIRANKNEPDFQNTGARGDPTILRRQANTQLLIKDGDTTVIGGIYTRNTGTNYSAVPFFHQIPILGFLFKTASESELRSELLIFITPRIVNRAESLGAFSAGSVDSGPSGGAGGGGATPAAGN